MFRFLYLILPEYNTFREIYFKNVVQKIINKSRILFEINIEFHQLYP